MGGFAGEVRPPGAAWPQHPQMQQQLMTGAAQSWMSGHAAASGSAPAGMQRAEAQGSAGTALPSLAQAPGAGGSANRDMAAELASLLKFPSGGTSSPSGGGS